MKVSIITPCKNSHEALRRIVKYKNALDIGDWLEWVVVDHASKPKLELSLDCKPEFNMKFVRTEDATPWILATLCNMGADIASGEYLTFWGIDSFPSVEWCDWAKLTELEYAVFPRKQAMLDEGGNLGILDGYGFRSSRNWVSRDVFEAIGAFNTTFDGLCYEDSFFALRYMELRGRNARKVIGPEVYCFPEKGDKRRPSFLHEEPKPDIQKKDIRKLVNSKLTRFQLEEIR